MHQWYTIKCSVPNRIWAFKEAEVVIFFDFSVKRFHTFGMKFVRKEEGRNSDKVS